MVRLVWGFEREGRGGKILNFVFGSICRRGGEEEEGEQNPS